MRGLAEWKQDQVSESRGTSSIAILNPDLRSVRFHWSSVLLALRVPLGVLRLLRRNLQEFALNLQVVAGRGVQEGSPVAILVGDDLDPSTQPRAYRNRQELPRDLLVGEVRLCNPNEMIRNSVESEGECWLAILLRRDHELGLLAGNAQEIPLLCAREDHTRSIDLGQLLERIFAKLFGTDRTGIRSALGQKTQRMSW